MRCGESYLSDQCIGVRPDETEESGRQIVDLTLLINRNGRELGGPISGEADETFRRRFIDVGKQRCAIQRDIVVEAVGGGPRGFRRSQRGGCRH